MTPKELEADNKRLRRRLQQRGEEVDELRAYVRHLEALMRAAEKKAGKRLFPREACLEDFGARRA